MPINVAQWMALEGRVCFTHVLKISVLLSISCEFINKSLNADFVHLAMLNFISWMKSTAEGFHFTGLEKKQFMVLFYMNL